MRTNSIRVDAWPFVLQQNLSRTVDDALDVFASKISSLTPSQVKYRMNEEWREFNQYVFNGRTMKFSTESSTLNASQCARLLNALLEIGDVISFAQCRYDVAPVKLYSANPWPVMDAGVLLRRYRTLYSRQFSDKNLFNEPDMWCLLHSWLTQVAVVQIAQIGPQHPDYYKTLMWIYPFTVLLWAYKWTSPHKRDAPLIAHESVNASHFWGRLCDEGVAYDPVLSCFTVIRRADGRSLDTEIDLPNLAFVLADEWD